MTDYKYDYQLNENMNNNYLDQKVKTNIISGYIYRGDSHRNIVLVNSPRFYGTYTSASMYVEEDHYLKRYTTMKNLRLLNLSNDDKDDVRNLLKFFTTFVLDKSPNKVDVAIIIVLLQVLFGLIDGKLNKVSLSDKAITDFLVKHKIENLTIELFIKIVDDLASGDTDTIPSRCSIRPLDKLLMVLMRDTLTPYDIDGTFYFQKSVYDTKLKSPNLLCNKVDENYDGGTTCVPSEICIFNPSESLGGVIFWKKLSGRFRRAFAHKKYKGYIKKNYDRLSIMDLYLLSKLYKNKKVMY